MKNFEKEGRRAEEAKMGVATNTILSFKSAYLSSLSEAGISTLHQA